MVLKMEKYVFDQMYFIPFTIKYHLFKYCFFFLICNSLGVENLYKHVHSYFQVPGFEWMEDLYGALLPEKLVYVGLRDVDAGEVEMLRRLNVAR